MPIFVDAREEAFFFLSVSSNILKTDKTTHPNSCFGRVGPKVKGKHFKDGIDQVFIFNRYGQGYSYVTTTGVHWRAVTTRRKRTLNLFAVSIKNSDLLQSAHRALHPLLIKVGIPAETVEEWSEKAENGAYTV
jgi:hypothetical protein